MFKDLKGKKVIVGLVHLLPMPSTPFYQDGNIDKMLKKAVNDSLALQKGGADGCLLQSVDGIYTASDDTDYARVATLSMISARVRDAVGPDFKIGVQLMLNCITPTLAVAKATGADFIRCTALLGATESQYGPVVSDPMKVLNYRKQIEAQGVAMISEISSYHFKGSFEKSVLQNMARSAMRVGADAVEVCNADIKINEKMVLDIKEAGNIPVILGGNTSVEDCQRRLKYADGALVGSCFEGGKWGGDIIESIVAEYCYRVRKIEE